MVFSLSEDLVNGAMGRRMTLQPTSSAHQPIPAERHNLKKAMSTATSVKTQRSSTTGRHSNESSEVNYNRRQSSRLLPITRRKTMSDVENEALVLKTGRMTASPRRKTMGDVGNEDFILKTGSMTASPVPKSRSVPHTRHHAEADVISPLALDEYREMNRASSRLISSRASGQYADEVNGLPVTSSATGPSATALPPQSSPPDASLPPLPPDAPPPLPPSSSFPLPPPARNKYSIHTIDDVHNAIISRRQAIDHTDSEFGNSSFSSLNQSGSGGQLQQVEDQNNHHYYVTRRSHRHDNAHAHYGTDRQINMAPNAAYHSDINQNSLQYSQEHAYPNSTEAIRCGTNVRQKPCQFSNGFQNDMSSKIANTSHIVKGLLGDGSTQSYERPIIKPVPNEVSENNFQVKHINHTNITDEVVDSKTGSTFGVSQFVAVDGLVSGEMASVLNNPKNNMTSAVGKVVEVVPVTSGFDNEVERHRNEEIKEPVVGALNSSSPDVFPCGFDSDDEERREGYTTPEEHILQLRTP